MTDISVAKKINSEECWIDAVKKITEWALREGLSAEVADEPSLEPERHRLSVYVSTKGPSPHVVAALHRRFILTPQGERLDAYSPSIEVDLVRHGGAGCVTISIEQLNRFTLEVHHIDRLG